MQGKTKNYHFVSKYISECSDAGYDSAEDIVQLTSLRISEIDEQLKEIVRLKEERSNLLDVLFVLKKNL